MFYCIKCGNTGKTADQLPCDCKQEEELTLPVFAEIPLQYQTTRFDTSFLPTWLQQAGYGVALTEVLDKVRTQANLNCNYLICAPPNSGKTVFAYTAYAILYTKGLPIPAIKDLLEFKRVYSDIYSREYDLINMWQKAPLAIFKVPYDVPSKTGEIISTIIDMRLRNNGSTIFLYDGSKKDLENQDTFHRLKYLFGDGSFHSMKVLNYYKKEEEKES